MGEKPTARALSCGVPRLPTSHRGRAGRATEQQKAGPNSEAKDGLVRSQWNLDSRNWPCWAPLMGEVGVAPAKGEVSLGFHKPHISHQKAKLCENSPGVRGGARLQVLRKAQEDALRWESLTWLPPPYLPEASPTWGRRH